MTSENIDEIEKEFKNLKLNEKDVLLVEQPTTVKIVEELEADFPDNEIEDIEIVRKPTDVKIVPKEE